MNKQFVAHIPARTIKGQTKVFNYPAREDAFECDENGRWFNEMRGHLTEDDVIDICKTASNWSEIRSIYFPMYGFHSDSPSDNTPSHKQDF